VTVLARRHVEPTKKPVIAPMWGKEGHALVASIAQSFLGSNATSSCKTLLPDVSGDLSQIASWADSVDHTAAYSWSAVLHYINTPDWDCNYNRSRDCVDESGDVNFCVDMAIQNYTSRLMDSSISSDQMSEALKFLVHFVGDIHQPLHVGFTSDEGGNSQSGQFIDTNNIKLHAIWDTAIIQKRIDDDFNGSQSDYLSSLLQRIAPGGDFAANLTAWQSCQSDGGDNNHVGACTIQWASEGIGYACTNSYVEADGVTKITDGFDLELDYYTRNLPIVELRLAQAGVRLGNVLNQIWPSPSCSHHPRISVD